MTEKSDFYLAYTTCSTEAEARALARGLVEAHLASCVNIGPKSVSVYPWKGQIEQTDEVVLTIKTRADKIEALTAHVRERHAYEVPELLWVKVEGGLGAYLDWAGEWLSAPSK